MKLDEFRFIYNRGKPDEWRIEGCQLRKINLIVGKNATGKSKIIKTLDAIANFLSGKGTLRFLHEYEWELIFDRNLKQNTIYSVKIKNGYVIQESLKIGNETLLTRMESGEGEIFAKALEGKIRFQTPKTELAVVKRRDTIQHPFLEDIHQWATSVRFYEFGTKLGKDRFVNIPEKIAQLEVNTDFANYDHVVGIFMLGQHKFGTEFQQAITSDMEKVGYSISTIGTKPPPFELWNQYVNYFKYPDLENIPVFLYVQESDLKTETEQPEMSQGMFRVLSLLIQVNYSLMAGDSSCIIIDDIGEGLDYQRASAIIKILIEKARAGSIQLIMTTNDENIMNGVPLEYWSVIERQPGVAKLHNYANSPEQFEQFKYIGLNNFDFFASEFYLQEPDSEEVTD